MAQQPNWGLSRLSRSHAIRHTHDRTPLYEWSARRRGIYPHHTTNTTEEHPCRRQDSNRRSQQLQAHTLDRSATGSGIWHNKLITNIYIYLSTCWQLGEMDVQVVTLALKVMPLDYSISIHFGFDNYQLSVWSTAVGDPQWFVIVSGTTTGFSRLAIIRNLRFHSSKIKFWICSHAYSLIWGNLTLIVLNQMCGTLSDFVQYEWEEEDVRSYWMTLRFDNIQDEFLGMCSYACLHMQT